MLLNNILLYTIDIQNEHIADTYLELVGWQYVTRRGFLDGFLQQPIGRCSR